MSVESTFAPADIELDPRFRLIAEWRFVPTIRKTKIQDAIFSSIFFWMEIYNYDLQPELTALLGGNMAVTLRKMGLFSSRLQKHMPSSLLNTVIRLHYLTQPIEKHMFEVEKLFYDKHGYSMTYRDLLKELENYRLSDCEYYQEMKKKLGTIVDSSYHSEFHWILNGDGACRKSEIMTNQ
jgi:hypothetical protein